MNVRCFARTAMTLAVCAAILCARAVAEDASIDKPIQRANFDERVYKTIQGRELRLHIFYPDGYSASRAERYPVAASFHGGAWTEGPIEWGHGDAQFMTSLGFVGVAIEYRLANIPENSALDCMKDAASAIRWIRMHADGLNVDPNRVLAIGHSAGGHLAFTTAMFPQIREKGENPKISSEPNAIVALAPAIAVGEKGGFFHGLLKGKARARDCSPADNVRKINARALIIQGTEDEYLSIATAQDFVERMRAAGCDIHLAVFQGGRHGFFYDDAEGMRYWKALVADFVANWGTI